MPSSDPFVAVTCCPNWSVTTARSCSSALNLHNESFILSNPIDRVVENGRVHFGRPQARAAKQQQRKIQWCPHSFPPNRSKTYMVKTTKSSVH